MIDLIFPDGSKRQYEPGVTGKAVAASIAPSLAKRAVLINHGPWRGSVLTVQRLCRCHPWGGAGYDPPPPPRQTPPKDSGGKARDWKCET